MNLFAALYRILPSSRNKFSCGKKVATLCDGSHNNHDVTKLALKIWHFTHFPLSTIHQARLLNCRRVKYWKNPQKKVRNPAKMAQIKV